MAGHSKWANIKRRKAAVDARKGKIFSKLGRELMVAAREGGGDPEANPRLRAAIDRAREANMPLDNIQRAILKGTGQQDDVHYEQLTYEGYGPGGVAFLLEILTDNRNRTAQEIRHLFTRHGGNLGEAGCVAWLFEPRGLVLVEREQATVDEDELLLLAADAGAEDFQVRADAYELLTAPEDLARVKARLEEAGLPIGYAGVARLPQTTVSLPPEQVAQVDRLVEALEDHDDVQAVWTNLSEES